MPVGGKRAGAGRPPIGNDIMVRIPKVWAKELNELATEMNTNRQQVIREAIYAVYGDRLSEAPYGRTKTNDLPKPHRVMS
jgi:hypothetical protein